MWLKTRTGALLISLQDVKSLAVETESDLKKTQETAAVSESQQMTLTDKVSSLTKELSTVRVERANVMADLNKMAPLVLRMKENVRKALASVCSKVQNTYEDRVEAVWLNIQKHSSTVGRR